MQKSPPNIPRASSCEQILVSLYSWDLAHCSDSWVVYLFSEPAHYIVFQTALTETWSWAISNRFILANLWRVYSWINREKGQRYAAHACGCIYFFCVWDLSMSLSEGGGGGKKFPSFLKHDRIAEDLWKHTAGQRGSSCGPRRHTPHMQTHTGDQIQKFNKNLFPLTASTWKKPRN